MRINSEIAQERWFEVYGFLEPLCGLEELWELVLGDVHLPGVHELQDSGQMLQKIKITDLSMQK